MKKGRSVIVTSHGKPVAKITPIVGDERAAEGARSALFARLRENDHCLSMNIQALLGGGRPKVVKLQSAIRALE